jgi:hypothetical protein
VAGKSIFYIDDVSLQAIEEPPLTITTPLHEYYIGEPLDWTVIANLPSGQVNVSLLAGGQLIAEQPFKGAGPIRGSFETRRLNAGVYTLQARISAPLQAPQTNSQQIILAPDPFEWRKP